MKTLLSVIIILVAHLGIVARADRAEDADRIKQAVGIIAAAKKPDVKFVLRDLRELRGKIVGVYEDRFAVDLKGPKNVITIGKVRKNPPMHVKYSDVLQIEGKGALLSVVPDPQRTPYSEWNAVRTVGVGSRLQVITTDGNQSRGMFMTLADDRITLLRGNTQTEIAKSEIRRIYQVAGDGKGFFEEALPIKDAVGCAINPFCLATVVPIVLGAAAIMHVLPKSGVKRVLIFAA
jgi:hypothetical protein